MNENHNEEVKENEMIEDFNDELNKYDLDVYHLDPEKESEKKGNSLATVGITIGIIGLIGGAYYGVKKLLKKRKIKKERIQTWIDEDGLMHVSVDGEEIEIDQSEETEEVK